MENITNKHEPRFNTSFGDFLREKRFGLARSSPNRRCRIAAPTQDEIALQIGISPASYRALEGKGYVNPTVETLFLIQEFYRTPDDEFWGQVVPTLRQRVMKRL